MNKRMLVTIHGIVQGVNFRYHTQMTARRLGVSGWVMNLPDGSVRACFEGDASAVDDAVAWCRRGPSSARVDRVEAKEEEFHGEFADFAIRH